MSKDNKLGACKIQAYRPSVPIFAPSSKSPEVEASIKKVENHAGNAQCAMGVDARKLFCPIVIWSNVNVSVIVMVAAFRRVGRKGILYLSLSDTPSVYAVECLCRYQ